MDKSLIKRLVDGARELKAEGREDLAGPLMDALRAVHGGDTDEARRLLVPALQQTPTSKFPWLAALHLAEDEESRQQAASRILELDPGDPDARAVATGTPPPLPGAAPPPLPGGPDDRVDSGEPGSVADDPQDLSAEELTLEPMAPDHPETTGTAGVTHTGTYEMFWDCEFCGAEKLLGKTHRYCPGCGAPQNPGKRYFPPPGEEVAVEDHRYVGADRVCGNCDTPNAAATEFCVSCGAPLTEAAEARRIQDGPPPEAPEPGKKSRKGLIGAALAGIAAVIGGLFFWTQDVSVSVAGHRWEREIKIEAYGPQSDSAWCDQMPASAYDVSRSREVRDHRRVPDGETCSSRRVDQGDGTYRTEQVCETKYREEPIYDDRCRYTVDRWDYARSVNVAGTDRDPHWPEFSLNGAGRSCHGCEREGDRVDRYILALSGEGETFDCSVDEALWQQAAPRSRWVMEVGAVMGEARCGSLEPAP